MKHLLLALVIATAPAHADQSVDELLAAFQNQLEAGGEVDELCDSLEDMDGALLTALAKELGKAWPSIRDRYLNALAVAAKSGVGGEATSQRQQIRTYRADFMAVYAMGEAQMKPLLKSKSMPAVKGLRKLLSPTPEELIAAHSSTLAPLHDAAHKLARFRDAALDAALSTTPTDSVSSLTTREAEVTAEASGLPRDGMKIIKKNREIAENNDIPADEAEGINECNLWRLYVGLNALVLDPKLCEASRDHSKDMAEERFFAHESPVPGKKTPWNRASNFGTTASGENIYMGSKSPHGANTGWFYSPGHHKNMFSGAQRRIGLGRYGSHWTQMFGR